MCIRVSYLLRRSAKDLTSGIHARLPVKGLQVPSLAPHKDSFSCLLGETLTLLHLERPKLCTILAFLSAVGLNCGPCLHMTQVLRLTQSGD